MSDVSHDRTVEAVSLAMLFAHAIGSSHPHVILSALAMIAGETIALGIQPGHQERSLQLLSEQAAVSHKAALAEGPSYLSASPAAMPDGGAVRFKH